MLIGQSHEIITKKQMTGRIKKAQSAGWMSDTTRLRKEKEKNVSLV
jgi:hypothetical protein